MTNIPGTKQPHK